MSLYVTDNAGLKRTHPRIWKVIKRVLSDQNFSA